MCCLFILQQDHDLGDVSEVPEIRVAKGVFAHSRGGWINLMVLWGNSGSGRLGLPGAAVVG